MASSLQVIAVGVAQGPEYNAMPPSVMELADEVMITEPPAGATKLYQTSGAPGDAQLGTPPLAALL
jgi:hypothetical protein